MLFRDRVPENDAAATNALVNGAIELISTQWSMEHLFINNH
jgi:hypothetical protein